MIVYNPVPFMWLYCKLEAQYC